MKQIIALLLCVAILGLTACTATGTESSEPAASEPSTESAVSEMSELSDESATSEASEEESTVETTEATTVPTTAAPTEPATTAAPTTKATTAPQTPDSVSTSSKGYEIVTTNGFTYVDGVLVVNKTYSLPADYYPGGLTSECDAAYDQMKAAAAKEGLSLYISSGFRSYDTQDVIYNRYVANDGKANADRYSARPGHSEHQTGLAIDLNGVSDSFGDTAEGKWVAAHAHEYGFILRYPKGKEAQTGYMYEPWHIRYVGVEVATKIFESDGQCLEEYYGITSAYT